MSDELFPEVQESLSPRLKWMREHNVSVHYNKDAGDGEPYEAYIGNYSDAVHDVARHGDDANQIAFSDTEDDALQKLAQINGWQMWWEKERPVWE